MTGILYGILAAIAAVIVAAIAWQFEIVRIIVFMILLAVLLVILQCMKPKWLAWLSRKHVVRALVRDNEYKQRRGELRDLTLMSGMLAVYDLSMLALIVKAEPYSSALYSHSVYGWSFVAIALFLVAEAAVAMFIWPGFPSRDAKSSPWAHFVPAVAHPSEVPDSITSLRMATRTGIAIVQKNKMPILLHAIRFFAVTAILICIL